MSGSFGSQQWLYANDSGYTVSNSLRLRSSASAYLSRTFGTPTNQKIGTFSFWVKRGSLGARRTLVSNDTGSVYGYWEFDSSDRLNFGDGVFAGNWTSTSVYRDPSAWYHIVIALDSTSAVNADRIKVYINNRQDITGSATVTQNANWYLLQNASAQIGAFTRISTYFDGYLTEVNFIDGQALDPTSFGETDAITGVWKAKKYAGTYGTNGFYLNFSDNTSATTLGYDTSGNGNNWTANNISLTAGTTYDSMLDVPTSYADGGNGRGNYSTWNPLAVFASNKPTLSNGNLEVLTTVSNFGTTLGTIGISSGKWYWEITPTAGTGGFAIGFANASADLSQYVGQNTNSWCYYNDGTKYTNNSSSAYGASFTTNDVIGVALDMDAGTVTFYKNGTTQGQAFSSLTGTLFPAVSDGGGYATSTFVANFGQRPFAYTPPTGFKALNTFNLPDSTIVDGSQYFDVLTWTGDNSSTGTTKTRSGLDFAPDLVWIKNRGASYWHSLFDSVRGTGSSKNLSSNTTNSEGNSASLYGYVSAFNADGFDTTNGSDASFAGIWVNQSAQTFVGWSWKAGGTAVNNTDGSITSSVSANTTSGFSIVTYTGNGTAGATIGHGLGVAPSMVIVKKRSGTIGSGSSNWMLWHSSIAATQVMYLDQTAAVSTNASVFNSTVPTSSVFSLGTNTLTNESTATFVAYCFADVPGFSKFGSYTGNGSDDGPFVFLGFRPRFLLIKNITNAQPWVIIDTARNTYNVAGDYLSPDSSGAENYGSSRTTATNDDILSNGFKLRNDASSSGYTNASGGTYIFAAFAENPFKNSLAR